MSEKWFNLTAEETITKLKTSKKGLEKEEALNRKKEYGVNSIKEEDKFNALKLLGKKFNSILIYVLSITALISLYLDQLIEFYAIVAVILFTVTLGFIHEYRAEKSVAALASLTAKKVTVLRNGSKIEELAENLVPGDVVVLKSGLVVPADLRILESNNLSVNESILTGESVPKGKNSNVLKKEDLQVTELDNIVFSGTSVMNGTGLGVVINIGFETEIGKISKTLISIKDQKTPLQKKVDSMSARVSYIVIALSILALFLLLGRGEELSTALILVAALAVAGIPEQFPLALTMSLSSGIRNMAHSNAIVKDMSSVETLGTTTVICTDKTGTLTQNKMMVVKFNIDGQDVSVEGTPYSPNATFKLNGKVVPKKELVKHKEFFLTGILCNDSEIKKEKKDYKLFGEPTEGALLGLSNSLGFNDKKLRKEHERLFEVPFDSAKKYMITVNKIDNKKMAYLKGAVEKVLNKSTHIRKKGKVVKITNKDKEKINEIVHDYSSQALRVLSLASKQVTSTDKKGFEKETKQGFVFEGLVGIEDPVREEVFDSIEQCKTAGVRVIMITGDHKNTAKAIGEQLDLITDNYYEVIEGTEIDSMTDKELDEAMSKVAIFARATPDHKFRIVKSLQREGEIVSMTGDGVNDAPALKKADIGVSMGKEGTDVAREASNLILTDDAFSSIVEAIRGGRTIYSNIRRFTYFLLTVNAAEVGIILVALLLNLVTPLTALMILFINVVISSFPALGLSVEATNNKVMTSPPRNPKEKLLSSYLMLKMTVVFPVMLAAILALFLWELNYGSGDIEKARTFAFATLIVAELFHAFNARSLHSTVFSNRIISNKYFYYGLGVAIVLIILGIYLPWANEILNTVPLSGMEWFVIILLSSLTLFVSELIKLFVKSEIKEQRLKQEKVKI